MYYLHQRLHARPDLLHLIKSNEYIEEKATSDASESIAHESNTVPLVGAAAAVSSASNGGNSGGASAVSPGTRAHKRFKRIVPAPSAHLVAAGYSQSAGPSGNGASGASGAGPSGNNSSNNNGSSSAGTTTTSGATSQNLSNSGSSDGAAARRSNARDFLMNTTSSDTPPSGEDGSGGNGGSTETSETTGEEMSVGKKSSSASESQQQMREVLAEQKYFGLLLQNFEAIFESLHNKKVLLAALRKDPNAPDHLIADLHDDIHVLSALKKEFRNKLRHTLE